MQLIKKESRGCTTPSFISASSCQTQVPEMRTVLTATENKPLGPNLPCYGFRTHQKLYKSIYSYAGNVVY